MIPRFVIWSSRNGSNRESDYRFALDEKNVENRVTGILRRYPNAEIKIYKVEHIDVTADFIS